MFENETGADFPVDGGEHVVEHDLRFTAWCYLRPVSGYTVCVQQEPPAQVGGPPSNWTFTIGGDVDLAAGELPGMPELGDFRCAVTDAGALISIANDIEIEPEAERVPWEEIPPDVQGLVLFTAGTGWEWDGVKHHYDPVADEWIEDRS